MKFASRYTGKELLDNDNIPFEDIEQNMKELNTINTYLGGHSITLKGFKQLATGKKSLTVCEIGCGGGDNLAAIYAYSIKENIELKIIGVDLKEACIQFARQRKILPVSTNFITSDYRQVQFDEKPDIIFSSLFCHHFSNKELLKQFEWMREKSKIGFFVNDLQRHPLAYYSIKFITSIFSASYLVKNDAPISVLRGFKKTELENISLKSNALQVKIHWQWAFRYLLVYKHAGSK